MISASPLKKEIVEDVDMIIVRELTGGLYSGSHPEGREQKMEVAVDTLVYEKSEIERIVHKAFRLAQKRKSVSHPSTRPMYWNKPNVERNRQRSSKEYPEVDVEHMLVDVAAMKLMYQPGQFDVMVTENMFGDILSDEASMITDHWACCHQPACGRMHSDSMKRSMDRRRISQGKEKPIPSP